MSDLVERLRETSARLLDAEHYLDKFFVGEAFVGEAVSTCNEAADALEQAQEKIALLTRTVEALSRERLTQMETGRP